MPVTTRAKLYRGILEDLQSGMTGIGPSRIYAVTEGVVDDSVDRCIQIAPGVGQVNHPDSGVGTITESFEVHIWVKVEYDFGEVDSAKLTDLTLGAFELADDVRRSLIQSMADGQATHPVVLIRTEKTEHVNSIAHITEIYRVGYEVGWINGD